MKLQIKVKFWKEETLLENVSRLLWFFVATSLMVFMFLFFDNAFGALIVSAFTLVAEFIMIGSYNKFMKGVRDVGKQENRYAKKEGV